MKEKLRRAALFGAMLCMFSALMSFPAHAQVYSIYGVVTHSVPGCQVTPTEDCIDPWVVRVMLKVGSSGPTYNRWTDANGVFHFDNFGANPYSFYVQNTSGDPNYPDTSPPFCDAFNFFYGGGGDLRIHSPDSNDFFCDTGAR